MFAQHDNRFIQNCHHVFHAANLVTNAAEGLQDPNDDLVPESDEAVAILRIKEWKNKNAEH